MLSVQPRPLRRSSTAVFWFSPAIQYGLPCSGDSDVSADDRHADSMVTVAMPPAHEQLLSGDDASSEALKGHDHTRGGGHAPSHALSAETRRWLRDALGEDRATTRPPGLVRVPSGASLASDDAAAADDAADPRPPTAPRGVSFAPAVAIQPIPHASTLSPAQRGRMYATAAEVRRNKARNRREFRYDGGDWRAATEERDMDAHAMTGEEVHPVHGYGA